MQDIPVDERPEITRNGAVDSDEIEALRTDVGWEQTGGTYEQILERLYSHYTARISDKSLVGYVSVISDGVADAFIVDLMVHPNHQGKGLGRRLVKRVVADAKRAGIQCVQVTFEERLAPFYSRSGFHIFGGGIIDFHDPDRKEEFDE